MTHVNPEQAVIDVIDELVDESLAPGPVDDYSVNRYDRCDLCRNDWHGLPSGGCPGAYATEAEVEEYRSAPSAHSGGYTLADIEAMRGGFSYQEHFDHVHAQVSQIPRQCQMPRVRFWAIGPDGAMRGLEGTLHIQQVHQQGDTVTIAGNLFPPVIQREQSINDALGEALEDADLSVQCQSWVPGRETAQEDVRPVADVPEGQLALEAAPEPMAGFQQVGHLDPSSFEIECSTEVQTAWGGRVLRTREDWSTSFTVTEVEQGPGFAALFGTDDRRSQ